MNAQHKLCKIGNRIRRIYRRLTELKANKSAEIMRAEKMKRDPVLSNIHAHINRLELRAAQLEDSLRAAA